MKAYVLDTSALLTLRSDESGAKQVADLLAETTSGDAICYGSFITLMEVLYRVWKNEGETVGRAAYQMCQRLPIEWVHESSELLQRAAQIKATQPLSLADAWIAATALELGAVLVHKDPEFENLPGLLESRLPYK
jgi:predicted nucleic acid-binding protein